MDGQSAPVVVRVRITVLDEPEAIVPKLQESVPVAVVPPQLAAPVPVRAHVPEGSVSESVTFVEAPVPVALTVIVNEALPPAATVALAAVLVTVTSGWHRTVIAIG